MQTGPQHVGSFSWMSTHVHGARGEGGEVAVGSDPCFPDISHNVEKRLRIRTLFHVRAFKLIMDGRIPLSALFSTPRRFRREKRARERVKEGSGRKHAGQGIADISVYNATGWMASGGCLGGWGGSSA